MKKLILVLAFLLTGCAALFSNIQPNDVVGTEPVLTETLRKWPECKAWGLCLNWSYDKLVGVVNPLDVPVLVNFDCNQFMFTETEVPAHSTYFLSVASSWRLAYVQQCFMRSWRIAPMYPNLRLSDPWNSIDFRSNNF